MEFDCIFCRIIAGNAPAFVVAEDDQTVAFLDRGQATEGHTLVVPRTHATDIWSISEVDASAVMSMAKRVAHLLDERLAPDGLNITQSNRAAGWQDVFHFHVHVIPRWTGDGLVHHGDPRGLQTRKYRQRWATSLTSSQANGDEQAPIDAARRHWTAPTCICDGGNTDPVIRSPSPSVRARTAEGSDATIRRSGRH